VPPELEGATIGDVFRGYRFKLADDLLRHYRVDYGELSSAEQARLVMQVLGHTNVLLEAARRLALCIQHANPSKGLPSNPIKKANRDVRAAELRDIEGLSYVEIGKRLSVPQFPSEQHKGDNQRVREEIVPNGRMILRTALGDQGYQQHIESAKAEIERRRHMSEEERNIEHWAHLTGIPVEDMRRILTGDEEDSAAAAAKLGEVQVVIARLARYAWTRSPREE
jgi:hypothetical protein